MSTRAYIKVKNMSYFETIVVKLWEERQNWDVSHNITSIFSYFNQAKVPIQQEKSLNSMTKNSHGELRKLFE